MSTQIFNKGEVIANKYVIQFYLGQVSNGQIYRVKNNDGTLFRLKIYNAATLSRHHFLDEGELLELNILQKLNHRNLIKLADSGEFTFNLNRYHYLATEFISGESLVDKLKREIPLSPYSAIPIIIQLLDAVQYLHSMPDPILHNSIIPVNVFLDYGDKAEKVVLTNFHSARFFSSPSKSFIFDDTPPYYLAPETFNKVVTPQSDLFSVGALLYTLLTGLPPWYVEIPKYQFSEEKLLNTIFDSRAKPLSFLKIEEDELDDQIINTLKKALSLDINERFQSADEFIKALKREVLVEKMDVIKRELSQKTKKEKRKNGKQSGFELIAGMQDLKELLYTDVISALNDPELYKSFGLTIPNGMLMYGPPGCGKTYFAERLAEEVGYTFISIEPSDLGSSLVHGTQGKIAQLFKKARDEAPTILFIDEFDALVPKRDENLQHHYASEVNEFLSQMSSCSESGIFIIAATNLPDRIDSAILRTGRLDKKIYVPPPDKKAREELFNLYLKDRPIDLDLDTSKLADLTKDYVSSDIKYIVDEASRAAIKTKSRISQHILESTLLVSKPSVSLGEIKGCEEYGKNNTDHEELDGKGSKERPFGFTISNDNQDEE